MFDAHLGVLKLNWLRILSLGLLLGAKPVLGAAVILYSTDFEYDEGYSTNALALSGQEGWLSYGSGGSGVLWDFLPTNYNQNAYIGYDAPNPGDSFLSVWQPFNVYPVASNTPVVVFSTIISIVPPDNGQTNSFYWSLYDAKTNRLFVLDFDDATANVFYAISGTNNILVPTGWGFVPNAYGPLTISMNFASNQWSAWLYSTLIVTNQPITTGTNALSLGAMAAEWAVDDADDPGDDYMIFDNYQLTATPIPAPQLRASLTNGPGVFLQVSSETNYYFVVEASSNLLNWSALDTNLTTSAGSFNLTDTNIVGVPARYYRARWYP